MLGVMMIKLPCITIAQMSKACNQPERKLVKVKERQVCTLTSEILNVKLNPPDMQFRSN